MVKTLTIKGLTCAHCGLPAHKNISENGLFFCCHGCKTAHQFISEMAVCELPDKARPRGEEELAFLDLPEIADKWVISKGPTSIQVRLQIPLIVKLNR